MLNFDYIEEAKSTVIKDCLSLNLINELNAFADTKKDAYVPGKVVYNTAVEAVDLIYRKCNNYFHHITDKSNSPQCMIDMHGIVCHVMKEVNQKYYNYLIDDRPTDWTTGETSYMFVDYVINDNEKADFFFFHQDYGPTPTVRHRRLSCSIQLTDPSTYTGSILEVFTGRINYKLPRDLGTMLVFPSNILHKVTPITSGKRRALVTWFNAPAIPE